MMTGVGFLQWPMMDFFLMRITLNPENVQVIAAIKRAMTPVQKQWLTIREIRMRMEEDKSFRFHAGTEHNRHESIHFYMLRSPETKKLFVRKTSASDSDNADRFALKENLRCDFCSGPFASDEAVPEICQSCCAVWHPDCLPLMAAGTSAAQRLCSECMNAGCRPRCLEPEAGPSEQGMSGGAPPSPFLPSAQSHSSPYYCVIYCIKFHQINAVLEMHTIDL